MRNENIDESVITAEAVKGYNLMVETFKINSISPSAVMTCCLAYIINSFRMNGADEKYVIDIEEAVKKAVVSVGGKIGKGSEVQNSA